MADVHFWLMVGLAVLILVLLAVALLFSKRKEIDYYTLFIFGIFWTAIGIPFHNYVMSAIGFVMVVIGLVNKKKWKKQKALKKLSKSQRKARIFILVGLAVLVVLFFVYLSLRR